MTPLQYVFTIIASTLVAYIVLSLRERTTHREDENCPLDSYFIEKSDDKPPMLILTLVAGRKRGKFHVDYMMAHQLSDELLSASVHIMPKRPYVEPRITDIPTGKVTSIFDAETGKHKDAVIFDDDIADTTEGSVS